jgi:CPA1 family monovalent cation:H+ antiporter
VETALGLLAIVAVIGAGTAVARRLRVPAALLLTTIGVVGSFLPFVPQIPLTPELVLVGLLPPLLYAAALRTSLIDFRTNRRAIGLLSIGLVVFTTAGVGLVTWWLLPVPLAAAMALGAVVAPPDAVATTAIARRVGMPRRIVSILEGESLLNDATALVALRTAVLAIGGAVTAGDVALGFLVAAGGGVLIGLAVTAVISWIRRRVTDVLLDTTLSFAAPFAAYLPAEAVHGSGVIAVVVTGLLLSHRAPVLQNAASRISERTNWATVQFLLENAVFLLIGLQAQRIVLDARTSSLGPVRTWVVCLAVLGAVLVLRPIWVFSTTYLLPLLPRLRGVEAPPPWQVPAVISWAGMRGVVTLAAVFAIPPDVPDQHVLVLAALVVVAGTLLLQGLSLPWLVRRLGLRGPDPREDALQHAVVLGEATEAGLDVLKEESDGQDPAVVARLRTRALERSNAAWERLGRPEQEQETPSQAYTRLRLDMLSAERERLVELRDEAVVPHEVLRSVSDALDVEESMLDRLQDADERRSEAALEVEPLRGVCDHLRQANSWIMPKTPGVCPDCIREGLTWVHLRLCLTCGKVGCCDSSPGKHARRHFDETGHPVIRSLEPGETWRWCYVDRTLG